MRITAGLLSMVSIATVCTLVLWARPSLATYSIVAVDERTGQVGGAVTSCVGSMDLSRVYGSAPGYGAVHAQAYINYLGRDQAELRLYQCVSPEAIIDEITSSDFDGLAAIRQYGVVLRQPPGNGTH